LDEVAVKVSRKNVEDNHVTEQVEIRHGNLLDTLHERADVIVANIIADVIIILADELRQFLKEESIFIASGIILDKIEEVTAALRKNRFEIVQIETMGEWAAIVSKPEGDQKDE